MFLRLNSLMQSIGITAPRHDTSGKLVNNENLIILYYIILITEHKVMGTQRKNHIMLNLKVLRIRKVINMEELLNPLHTLLGKIDYLILLVYDKVSGLLLLDTHDGIHLGILRNILTSGQLLCQNITGLIQFGGLAALSGNNKRSTCLIN